MEVKVLFDTSVLVAALVESHPNHPRALDWFARARGGDVALYVCSHTLAELYAVLTRLPVRPRISPLTAWRLIHTNLDETATIVDLSASDYVAAIKSMADAGLSGGVMYDALLARAAERAGVERLLTFNARDFRRLWPDGAGVIHEP